MRMIAAVDENWGLGKNGDLLTSIPEDMRFFRQTTQGKALVMGSKTLRSFPNAKPLPGRLNIVMTRQKDARFPGCVVCDGIDSLLALLAGFMPDDVMVIGGGGIYTQLLPYCTEALITKMRFNGGADTFLPDLDSLPEWSVAEESEQKEHDGIKFSFLTYKNSAVKPLGDSAAPLSTDMSSYFKNNKTIELEYYDTENQAYKAELKALLNAFFHPLGEGVSANEVKAFLENEPAVSFESYLRQKRLIAARADIEALAEKYANDSAGSRRVTLEKGQPNELYS